MGINLIGSRSSYDRTPKQIVVGRADFHPYKDFYEMKDRLINLEKANTKQPRADKYVPIKVMEVGSHLVVELQYKNCFNYEGRKILVFKDINFPQLLKVNNKLIDPHFSENKNFISPVARFEPTEEGLEQAIRFAREIL